MCVSCSRCLPLPSELEFAGLPRLFANFDLARGFSFRASQKHSAACLRARGEAMPAKEGPLGKSLGLWVYMRVSFGSLTTSGCISFEGTHCLAFFFKFPQDKDTGKRVTWLFDSHWNQSKVSRMWRVLAKPRSKSRARNSPPVWTK